MGLLIFYIITASFGSPPGEAQTFPFWQSERRIQGENNLQPVEAIESDALYESFRSIAMVRLNFHPLGLCTATKIGKDLFLSNFHCDDFARCHLIEFVLGYESDIESEQRQVYACKEIVASNPALDYIIYRGELTSDPSEDESVYPTLKLEGGPIEAHKPLVIASHPDGRPKEIDQSEECFISDDQVKEISKRQTVLHMCDTESGSSGAPLFDRDSGKIVALHWGGRHNEDEKFNFAIPINLVIEDLKKTLSDDLLIGIGLKDPLHVQGGE